MVERLKGVLAATTLITLFLSAPVNANSNSANRNPSNNGVACTNSQSSKAKSDNSRNKSCLSEPFILNVTINGTVAVGETLNAAVGTVTGNPIPTLAYQWNSGISNVGTNSSSYTIVGSDSGKTISVYVTATNSVGTYQTSAQTIIVPSQNYALATFGSGTASFGYSASSWGQTFTIPAGKSGTVSSIDGISLSIPSSSTITNAQVKIWDSPSKTNLIATSSNTFSFPASPSQYGGGTAYFTPFNVVAGQSYYFELERLTGDGYFFFYSYYGNTYAGGSAYLDSTQNLDVDLPLYVNISLG